MENFVTQITEYLNKDSVQYTKNPEISEDGILMFDGVLCTIDGLSIRKYPGAHKTPPFRMEIDIPHKPQGTTP